MADDEILRSYRSNDPYRPVAEPERSRDHASTGDPLVELARLIGQSDPFVEFGRNAQRQSEPRSYPQQESRQDRYAAPDHDDWQFAPARGAQSGDYSPRLGRDKYDASEDYASHASEAAADGRRSDLREDLRIDPDYQDSHDDRGQRHAHEQAQDGSHDADPYEPVDSPLEPHEDEMYDDAPRKRHHGLATALALIGCAVLGTAAAYGYRSYYSHPNSAQPPPVIIADSSMPTKIMPASVGDQQSSKAAQDRVAHAGKEQIISKQEEPVVLKELGTQAAPRVVLPAPVAPAPPVAGSTTPSALPPSASGSTEPRKVKTVTIRPDGADLAGRPVASPAGRPITPPAPRAAPGRNGGPISLDPQSPVGDPAAPPRSRTATAPTDRIGSETTTNSTGGFLVQLSSQRSESEALTAFRSLQTKFPNELGGRQPVIRRADLGSKGVFYRTNVGPFASAHEASRFCASYKAAGGQCVVPNN